MINQNLKATLTRVCYGMLGVLLALVLAVPGWATADSVAPPFVEGTPALDLGRSQADRPAPDNALDDRQDLEAFVDSVFNQETEAGEVPGGAIAGGRHVLPPKAEISITASENSAKTVSIER